MIEQIRESGRCYKDIPVTYKKGSIFLEPIAHAITQNPNEILVQGLLDQHFTEIKTE